MCWLRLSYGKFFAFCFLFFLACSYVYARDIRQLDVNDEGANQLFVYDEGSGKKEVKPLYEITVQQGEKNFPIVVHFVPPPQIDSDITDGAGWYRDRGVAYRFSQFSYEGDVTVFVKRSRPITSAKVRPTRLGVVVNAVGKNTISFKLSRRSGDPGQKISVEFDGGTAERLIVFADPLEKKEMVPLRDAPDVTVVLPGIAPVISDSTEVVFFEAGIHQIGVWKVPSRIRHIYLAGGSYVHGAFDFGDRGNVMMSGRGVVSGESFRYLACRDMPEKICAQTPWKDAIHLLTYGGKGFRLEGITFVRPPHWVAYGFGAKAATFENFKIIGTYRFKEDGVELSDDGVIKDCFINAMDDSIKMFGKNGRVNNCVIWQGANGSVFQYGWWNKTAGGNEVLDIDVIHADWTWGNGDAKTKMHVNNNAVFGFVAGLPGDGVIRNERYKRINVETPVLRVFGFQVPKGQQVRDLYFEDISIAGVRPDDRWKTNYFIAEGGVIEGIKFSRISVGGDFLTEKNFQNTGKFEFIGASAEFQH